MKTGIVRHPIYLEHHMAPHHPESPERLEAIYRLIDENPSGNRVEIKPREASRDEILRVHTASYFDRVTATAGKSRTVLDIDTSTSAKSFQAALMAAGGVLNALDAVMGERIRNGFALVRPPGHHAEASRAMGFCIFNNIAVGAEHLLQKHSLERVFIMDWDLHHGNGTQHSFEERKDIFYSSTHQWPFYPGTGHWSETGHGPGEGFTLNVPMTAGKTDDDYLTVFERVIAPAVRRCRPDFILSSAGFDIYEQDPLGGMKVTLDGFGHIAGKLKDLAEEVCGGRILFVLEGGYHVEAEAEAVLRILDRLELDNSPPLPELNPSQELLDEIQPVLDAFSLSS
jgi:acetoin utilization deacetylase AcuC-like enzyme